MADEISDGVCLAGARRALNQDASVFFQLLRDANLFWVGRFAEQNVNAVFGYGVFRSLLFGRFGHWNGRFFANNIQERPRQVLSRTQISKYAFNRGRITQRASTQENDRVAADGGIKLFTRRRGFFDEFAARRKLYDHTLEEIRRCPVI